VKLCTLLVQLENLHIKPKKHNKAKTFADERGERLFNNTLKKKIIIEQILNKMNSRKMV
jgi:hypothetical protein